MNRLNSFKPLSALGGLVKMQIDLQIIKWEFTHAWCSDTYANNLEISINMQIFWQISWRGFWWIFPLQLIPKRKDFNFFHPFLQWQIWACQPLTPGAIWLVNKRFKYLHKQYWIFLNFWCITNISFSADL